MEPGAAHGEGKKSFSGRVEAEARLAREIGVSPKRLDGWEPRRTTTHYNANHEVTGYSVTVTEAEWDVGQIAHLIASRQIEADIGAHGVPMSKATDPAFASRVHVEMVNDHVAEKLAVEERKFQKLYDHQEQAGWRFIAVVDD